MTWRTRKHADTFYGGGTLGYFGGYSPSGAPSGTGTGQPPPTGMVLTPGTTSTKISPSISVISSGSDSSSIAPAVIVPPVNGAGIVSGSISLGAGVDTLLYAAWFCSLSSETSPMGNGGQEGFLLVIKNNVTTGNDPLWTLSVGDGVSNNMAAEWHNMPSTADLIWHSVAISIRASTQTCQLYLDGVAKTPSVIGWNALASIGFPSDQFYVSGATPASQLWLSNMRLSIGEAFFDLSNATNYAKLFGAGNKAISWGANGSLVTGTQPKIFLKGSASTYGTNLGSAGGTFSGGLIDAPYGPPV